MTKLPLTAVPKKRRVKAFYSLPSIYLGSTPQARAFYLSVYDAYSANRLNYPSLNLFIRHLIQKGLEDTALKRAA